MASRHKTSVQADEWARLGVAAARKGEALLARGYLARAVEADRRNPSHRLNLAAVFESQGMLAEAAVLLAETLALAPDAFDAADRLSSLLSRYRLEDNRQLDPQGLRAALAFDRIDGQSIGEVAIARLKQEGLIGLPDAIAQLPRRTADALRNDLLLTALATAINKDASIESWLAGLRRTLLLETPPERFEERALQSFALALVRQTLLNEHVWPETAAETSGLQALAIDQRLLFEGDPEMGRRLLLALLYRPFSVLLSPGAGAEALAKLRPKALRELVVENLREREAEQRLAAAMPRLAQIADDTSRRVQAQYEAAPYPRWRSLRLPRAGTIARALARYLPAEQLERLKGAIDVLIVGAGTGRQALQSASGYGPAAQVTAVDLSAASLAYAARKAGHFGVTNITFRQADLLVLHPAAAQYDVIECVGVLHHMADPWLGLTRIAALMKPGGIAYLGLYSALARKEITALRNDPAYPGPDCDDAAARQFRRALLEGPQGERFAASKDFYSLSEFRDLTLNASEQTLTLGDIAANLERLGLTFLGFTIDPDAEAKYAAAFPGDRFPGTLASWIALEAEHPHVFDAMYRFWVRKAD
jgi:2-polyprenyl-3-methyl-5-hydroxy-6-metoxy-1,4-benzoquinol methylase